MLAAYAVGMALHQRFPTWLYHHTEPARIVHSQEELEALGDGWHNSPADVKPPAATPADLPPAPPRPASLGRLDNSGDDDDAGDPDPAESEPLDPDAVEREDDLVEAAIEKKPPRGAVKRK